MMRELNLNEIREIQLNILRVVHTFCIENNIRYSLGGGTLLGAIRHKGYIPWDDDIDIMMPRPDYDLFIERFSGSNSQYICACYENDPEYQFPFAKIFDNKTLLKEVGIINNLSVNIDLFPVDGLPSDEKQIRRHVKAVKRVWQWIRRRNREIVSGKHTPLQRLGVLLIKSTTNVKLQDKIKSLCYKYDYKTSDMAGAIIGLYGMREVYPKSTFEEYIDLPFEDNSFRSIAAYDLYLAQHYGDYMQLPPLEKQVRGHNVRAYALE